MLSARSLLVHPKHNKYTMRLRQSMKLGNSDLTTTL